MLTFAAERPMDLEVKTLTDAPAGLRSPERGSRGNTSPGAKGLLREHSSQLRLGRLQGKDEHRPMTDAPVMRPRLRARLGRGPRGGDWSGLSRGRPGSPPSAPA